MFGNNIWRIDVLSVRMSGKCMEESGHVKYAGKEKVREEEFMCTGTEHRRDGGEGA